MQTLPESSFVDHFPLSSVSVPCYPSSSSSMCFCFSSFVFFIDGMDDTSEHFHPLS